MHLNLNPRKTLTNLIYIFVILFLANTFTVFLQITYHYSNTKTIVRMFNFNTEQNIPTLFSFLILLLSGFFLLYIARSYQIKNNDFKTWRILGFIFLFLALDEAVSIHEIFGHILTTAFNLEGYFYYSWVIPYGIILILLFVFMFKFIINLPKRTLILFIFSGLTYVIGVIGIEMISSNIASDLRGNSSYNLTYSILYTIEESLEMLGIIIFIYSLLNYISQNNFSSLKITALD